ncbi:MAG: hypothetical protein VST68_01510 [Nitrospirota bacterium]|nr:hypothetical protein [Nitrospirota bacterium]
MKPKAVSSFRQVVSRYQFEYNQDGFPIKDVGNDGEGEIKPKIILSSPQVVSGDPSEVNPG